MDATVHRNKKTIIYSTFQKCQITLWGNYPQVKNHCPDDELPHGHFKKNPNRKAAHRFCWTNIFTSTHLWSHARSASKRIRFLIISAVCACGSLEVTNRKLSLSRSILNNIPNQTRTSQSHLATNYPRWQHQDWHYDITPVR